MTLGPVGIIGILVVAVIAVGLIVRVWRKRNNGVVDMPSVLEIIGREPNHEFSIVNVLPPDEQYPTWLVKVVLYNRHYIDVVAIPVLRDGVPSGFEITMEGVPEDVSAEVRGKIQAAVEQAINIRLAIQ